MKNARFYQNACLTLSAALSAESYIGMFVASDMTTQTAKYICFLASVFTMTGAACFIDRRGQEVQTKKDIKEWYEDFSKDMPFPT